VRNKTLDLSQLLLELNFFFVSSQTQMKFAKLVFIGILNLILIEMSGSFTEAQIAEFRVGVF
jgi:hypothetical protein